MCHLETQDLLDRQGGLSKLHKVFGQETENVVKDISEALVA